MAAMTIKIDALNLEPVKAFIEICKGLESDERISKEIRDEYANAFSKALEIAESERK